MFPHTVTLGADLIHKCMLSGGGNRLGADPSAGASKSLHTFLTARGGCIQDRLPILVEMQLPYLDEIKIPIMLIDGGGRGRTDLDDILPFHQVYSHTIHV